MQNKQSDIVFNYSSYTLSEPMKSLLNRALNFAFLPLKLDLTQVLVDFNRFARTVIRQEFWFGRDTDNDYKPIFKTHKTNLPKNHSSPASLKTFLSSIKSEIMDPKNRQVEESNLPPEEVKALKELIRLQRERLIVIKAADKGAGIVILDFEDYLKSCYDHLLSSVPSQSLEEVANPKMYYEPVDEFALERARKTISDTLKEALENEIITKDEFTIMNPKDKNASKFYCNFKVHKQTEHGQIPPVRPIISGSGAITEKISLFIEHHIKELSMKHPSYLQDTTHFLRVIEKFNKGIKLPSNSMLLTSDVTNAYGNIPKDDGSTCLKEALEEREDMSIPSDFLVKLMDLVQKLNIFEFHYGQLWKQLHGVAMGINTIPSFANIYMARRIDKKKLNNF